MTPDSAECPPPHRSDIYGVALLRTAAYPEGAPA